MAMHWTGRGRVIRSAACVIRPATRPRRSGFTLTETALALFVIALGVVPVVALLINARRLGQQAQVQTAAYAAARQQLESLRSLSYANRPAASGVVFSLPAAVTTEFPIEFPNAGTTSYASYDVLSRADLGDSQHPVQQIVVRVFWVRGDTYGAAATSGVRLTTLVAKGSAK